MGKNLALRWIDRGRCLDRINELLKNCSRNNKDICGSRGSRNVIQCGPISNVFPSNERIITLHFFVSYFFPERKVCKSLGESEIISLQEV